MDSPPGYDPIGLDMNDSYGKRAGLVKWTRIGRYWPRIGPKDEKYVQHCDYRGKFSQNKCNTGCGEPTQRW